MARSKRGKRPGKGLQDQIALATSKVREASSISRPGSTANGYSMRDEARNTLSHQSFWGQSEKLRQKPVAFVSAGFVEPLKDPISTESALTETAAESGDNQAHPVSVDDISNDDSGGKIGQAIESVDVAEGEVPDIKEEMQQRNSSGSQDPANVDSAVPPTFFFDLIGSKAGAATKADYAETIDDVESSEEIILFTGRSGRGRGSKARGKRPMKSRAGKKASDSRRSSHDDGDVCGTHLAAPNSSRDHHQTTEQEPEQDEEDAILADYISNMVENDSQDDLTNQLQALGRRELGDPDSGFGGETIDEPDLPEGYDMADGAEGFISNWAKQFIRTTEMDSDLDLDGEIPGPSSEEEGGSSDEPDRSLRRIARRQEGLIRSSKQRTGNPSFTDAFGELDIGAWDQPDPLMKRKARRSKQPPNFNVSDSELEAALRKAWERDRERKKGRKAEREKLRAAGLLRKKATPDDLRVKYQSGMTLDEVQHEFVGFLMSDLDMIHFPPVAKQVRASLHDLARQFGIKSHSTGKGDNRRPVLSRTGYSLRYSEDELEDLERRIESAMGWIKRKNGFSHGPVRNQGNRLPGSGGRSGYKALVFRDGEVAGASIPELGPQNTGRMMLEKMGWAKGMGLGALENKGILEPVAQVVKNSKAGLG
ncbi:hypothetical protein QBC47DRAFT_386441 [Echria macrotheca]|uniref:Protein SQS1 n=1 Tax=Echria macrotheca TaxID=438768 RepID=A0AAJ0BCS0_9PEZI|nr:hypothetical protein QBC47DRAFT_386441 [Echria macrotheca]